jgi:hypothetical protein
MTNIKCLICNKNITGKKRKFCSNECLYSHKLAKGRDHTKALKLLKPKPKCLICQNIIPEGRRTLCSIDCKKKQTLLLQMKNRKISWDSENKECIFCNSKLPYGKFKFCSLECRKKYRMTKDNGVNSYLCFKKSIQNIKAKLVKAFGGSCQSCGYNKNYAALHFHHKDPKTKSFGLNSTSCGKHSWLEILEESSKCSMLCSNCHMELHHPDRQISKHNI